MSKSNHVNPVHLRIKMIQKHFKWTNSQMAGALGVIPNTYREQRIHEKTPQLYSLIRLDQKFGVSIEWVLFERGPMFLKDREKKKSNAADQDLFHKEIVDMEKQMRKVPKLRYAIMQIYHNYLLENPDTTK